MKTNTKLDAWTRSLSNLPSYGAARSEEALPLTTRLGSVRIGVTSAERALSVWRDLVGLEVIEQNAQEIVLGAGGNPLIELELGASTPAQPGSQGLYHVAIHVPTRRDLAGVIARLMQAGYQNAPVDHLINEVTYFSDLDGNGIEINYESPERGYISYNEEEFNRANIAGYDNDGNPHSARERLDLNSLFQELDSDTQAWKTAKLSAGSYVGHLHLTVNDIKPSFAFYRDVLGFKFSYANYRFGVADVIVDYPPHIIALNTWGQPGGSRRVPNAAGLRHFTVAVPSVADMSALAGRLARANVPTEVKNDTLSVSDPAGNLVKIKIAN